MTTILMALSAAPARATSGVPVRSIVVPEVMEDSRSCGGTSPVKRSCSTGAAVRAASITVVVSAGLGYTGRVVATMSTTSAFYTYDCALTVYPLLANCTPTVSGTFYPGQQYTLVGEADGVGQWSVGVQN